MAGDKDTKNSKCVLCVTSICVVGVGVIPGIVLITMYNNFDDPPRPCDAPIAYWLFMTAIVSFALLGLTMLELIVSSMCGKMEDGKWKKPPIAKALNCLGAGPTIYALYLWIRGQMWVYGSFPNATIVELPVIPADRIADGTVPVGVGCDPDLWYGARTWLYVTYGCAGGSCALACCFVCIAIIRLKKHGDANPPSRV